jgi:hypothetical protein
VPSQGALRWLTPPDTIPVVQFTLGHTKDAMRRALLVASALLLCVHAAWVADAHFATEGRSAFGLLLWAAVPLAAFLVALFVRRRQFLAGVLVALPASALFAMGNAAYEHLGHPVDFPGVLGALFVFGMSLPVCGLLAAAGAGAARLSPFRSV